MHQTYQTYQTSHLTLQDLQNNDVSAEDLIELCIELGEEYSDFGFSSYIPESSVIAALQPTVWTPPSPITRTRQENALLFGTGESARAARERAIRSLLEEKKAPYEEAVQLVEQRWEEMPKDPCEDGSTTCVGQETLEDWKKSDLYEKVAIMYRYQHPPPKDPRDVEVLLNDGHSTELRKIRLQSTDSLDKVTGIFRELSMRYNDEGELVESGSGAWMYQLMNARRKSVVGRRKLLSDRDYRMMVKEINGKDTKTPYAVVVQESTPVKVKKEGLPIRKKPVEGEKSLEIPEDIVLEDGTVLSGQIDWDKLAEEIFGSSSSQAFSHGAF